MEELGTGADKRGNRVKIFPLESIWMRDPFILVLPRSSLRNTFDQEKNLMHPSHSLSLGDNVQHHGSTFWLYGYGICSSCVYASKI